MRRVVMVGYCIGEGNVAQRCQDRSLWSGRCSVGSSLLTTAIGIIIKSSATLKFLRANTHNYNGMCFVYIDAPQPGAIQPLVCPCSS